MAFYVDRTIGLFKIPNTALQLKEDHVEVADWGLNITDQMVTQSYLRNISMIFVEGWTVCLPSMNSSNPIRFHLHGGKKQAKRTALYFNGTLMNAAFVDAQFNEQLIMCPRNFSVYDKTWASFCLKEKTSVHNCTQSLLSQFTEMLVFDFLISNNERLQPRAHGNSNNVHVLNYDPAGDMAAVYIDQGHHTFEAHNEQGVLDLLDKHCIFPIRLMRLLGRFRGSIVDAIKRTMGDVIVSSYESAVTRGAIGAENGLDRLLAVVESRFSALRGAVKKCERRFHGIFGV